MSDTSMNYLDALYGHVRFDEHMAALVAAPIVQRLRHVRLSNIDSLAMPGISNLSRYEHVLGVGHLTQRIGLRSSLTSFDQLTIGAAALLHDWAITAFGHLVEEAFRYAGVEFHHEDKLQAIMLGEKDGANVGGADLQILAGRETQLTSWARRAVGEERARELLTSIQELIRGEGRFGHLIAGTMDLDNIDNIYRVAFHMGISIDRYLPKRLAEAIVAIDEAGGLVLATSAINDVKDWVSTRRTVYEHLMPAQPDFSMKAMIVSAAKHAIEAELINSGDWHLTDHTFLCRLSTSSLPAVKDTIGRWTAGEFWESTPLWWLEGQRPSHAELNEFSDELSSEFGRHCFAYGIKDKRERKLRFRFDDGSVLRFGSDPCAWLFGVVSSKRAAFTRQEANAIVSTAERRFGSRPSLRRMHDSSIMALEERLL